jgi:hypothetical protein
MSDSNWYYDKAKESGRMATLASDPLIRDRHLLDQKDWQAIANRIVAAEAAVKAKGSK